MLEDLLSMNAGVSLGIIGWIGYQIREIPMYIWSIIRQRISVTIEFKRTDLAPYLAMTKWLFDKFPSLKDHSSNNLKWGNQEQTVLSQEIAQGTYYFMMDAITPVVVSSYLQRGSEEMKAEKYLSVFIYGPNRKKYLELFHQFMNTDIANERNSSLLIRAEIDEYLHDFYVPNRSFDTVFCKYKDQIKNILDIFLRSKDLYNEHGITYKTGFLFYGPPGSGKSTLVRAIASYMKWPVVYFSEKINPYALYPRTVYVFEDIDCITTSREEEPSLKDLKRNRIPLHTLLNLVDGMISPNEVIFIATTNYIDQVDPALRRQGRFDHSFEVNYLDRKEAEEMCESYGIDTKILEEYDFPLSGAVLQNRILYDQLGGVKNG